MERPAALRSMPFLYYFQIHLRHLLAPFPFWRPLIPLSVALLRCVSFTLARMKNSRRILAHSYLEIVLHRKMRCISTFYRSAQRRRQACSIPPEWMLNLSGRAAQSRAEYSFERASFFAYLLQNGRNGLSANWRKWMPLMINRFDRICGQSNCMKQL